MNYTCRVTRVEAILATDWPTILGWLRREEFSKITTDTVTVLHQGTAYTAFLGCDYLVRDHHGVYPMTKETFEAQFEEER